VTICIKYSGAFLKEEFIAVNLLQDFWGRIKQFKALLYMKVKLDILRGKIHSSQNFKNGYMKH
jgi:hypothetical protein